MGPRRLLAVLCRFRVGPPKFDDASRSWLLYATLFLFRLSSSGHFAQSSRL